MSDLLSAWQAALAAEHQAVFGYGLLGPRLATPALRGMAASSQQAHITLRNDTTTAIEAAGVNPVRPLPDYPALYPVASSKAAIALAVRLEAACATAWRFLYAQAATANGNATLRASAQQALTASAVRATQWRTASGDTTPTDAFPGI